MSTDPLHPHTVEFWLRGFVAHAEKTKADFEKQPPQVALLFCRFVIKKLLASPCFLFLGKLAPMLVRLEAAAPSLLPAASQAIIGLERFWRLQHPSQTLRGTPDAAGAQEEPELLDLFSMLPLAVRSEVVQSVLYHQLVTSHFREALQGLKQDHKVLGPQRYKMVLDLKEKAATVQEHDDVEALGFAETWFSPTLNMHKKLEYVLSKWGQGEEVSKATENTRWHHLEEWDPESQWLHVRPLFGKDDLKKASASMICKGMVVWVSASPRDTEPRADLLRPTARGLLSAYTKLRGVLASHKDCSRCASIA